MSLLLLIKTYLKIVENTDDNPDTEIYVITITSITITIYIGGRLHTTVFKSMVMIMMIIMIMIMMIMIIIMKMIMINEIN